MSDPTAPSDRRGVRRPATSVEIPVSALAVLGLSVIGTILLLRAIDRTQQLISLAILGAILTALLAPAVRLLQRFTGRATATVLLHFVVFVAVAAGTGLLLQQIGAGSDSLAEFTQQQIDTVDADAAEPLRSAGLDDRLGEAVAQWGTTAVVGEDSASGIATRASQLVIVIVLSIFFTLQGSSVVDLALTSTQDRDRRRRMREMWEFGSAAASTYLRRNALVAALSGIAASALAAAFGLPAIVLIGVWAGLLCVVPLLGAVVGWAPIVVITSITSSPEATVAVAVIAIGGVIAVNVLRARYVVAPVHPGSFLIAMSIAAGVTAAGIPGAIAAMFAMVALVNALTTTPRSDHLERVDGDVPDDPNVSPPAPEPASLSSTVLDEMADDHGAHRVADDDAPLAGASDEPVRLTLTKRTGFRITAFVIAAYAVQLAITRVGPILVWALIGALIAVGLDRPVSWIEARWDVRRSVLVIVTAICATAAVGALLLTATGSMDDGQPMDEGIPEFVEALESLPLVGPSIDGNELETRIQRVQDDLPRLITRSPIAGQTVGILGGGIVGAFWVTVAALSCLLDGPRLISAIQRRTPARIARQSARLARAGKIAIGGYVAGAAVVAAMNGAIVAILGVAFGVPVVALLALWAFSWNFVPQVGAIIGWAPLVLLALLGGPLRGGLCLAIFIVYQVIENNAIQPTIVGHAVDISALAALGAALAGGALAGLVGAALAIPVAGVARAVHRESRRDDFPSLRPRPESPDSARQLP